MSWLEEEADMHSWMCMHCGDAGPCDTSCEEEDTHEIAMCGACRHFMEKLEDD